MSFFDISLLGCLILLSVSLLLSLIRLAIGPSLADRIVALEIMTFMIIGIAAVFSILMGQRAYLEVALIISLISFLTTVAFAYYLERRIQR